MEYHQLPEYQVPSLIHLHSDTPPIAYSILGLWFAFYPLVNHEWLSRTSPDDRCSQANSKGKPQT
ncbi:hypothetical protein RSAG8_09916, partial [Rhizoctonia solani AG-8 WAC10335]